MSNGRDLSPVEVERAKTLLLETMAREDLGLRTQVKMALALGYETQGNVSKILSGKQGMSIGAADKLIEIAGVPRERIFDESGIEAGAPAVASPEPVSKKRERAETPKRTVEYDDPYPNRPAAVELMRGIVDPETIKSVLSIGNKAKEIFSIEEWVAEIEGLERLRRQIFAKLKNVDVPSSPPQENPVDRAKRLALEKDTKRRQKP